MNNDFFNRRENHSLVKEQPLAQAERQRQGARPQGGAVIEKLGPVRNPLTIIAIFAGFAEISGTVILPFIAPDSQAIYVWFLIVFPTLLVVLFFLTLNFNHKVLYAPSDYRNEDHFLRSLPRATFAEKALKIEEELAEAGIEQKPSAESDPECLQRAENLTLKSSVDLPSSVIVKSLRRSAQARYVLAEELIFKKLGREFSTEIQREVKIGALGRPHIFDGIVRENDVTTVIEVKLVRRGVVPEMQLVHTLARIHETAKMLPPDQRAGFRLILALASDGGKVDREQMLARVALYKSEFPFSIDVRIFDLEVLEREFDVVALTSKVRSR